MIRIALKIAWSTHVSGIRIRNANPANTGIRNKNLGDTFEGEVWEVAGFRSTVAAFPTAYRRHAVQLQIN